MIDTDPEDGDLAQARHRIRVLEREQRELQQTLEATKRARDLALEKRLEAELAQADLRAALERAEERKDRWRMVARRRLKQAQHRESIIDAFFAGEFACVDCGVPTNNGRCNDCMNGNTPAAKTAAEVRRAVEAETERCAALASAVKFEPEILFRITEPWLKQAIAGLVAAIRGADEKGGAA